MNKDVAVGCFRVPAACANATRKTARGRNWFSKKLVLVPTRTEFLELRGVKAHKVHMLLTS